uniref:(northern house mosquito) hypothetical protein n=1 Tax=Culex pipiens TaxID=7175 RepID=A0A8D8HAV6_CULPI
MFKICPTIFLNPTVAGPSTVPKQAIRTSHGRRRQELSSLPVLRWADDRSTDPKRSSLSDHLVRYDRGLPARLSTPRVQVLLLLGKRNVPFGTICDRVLSEGQTTLRYRWFRMDPGVRLGQ